MFTCGAINLEEASSLLTLQLGNIANRVEQLGGGGDELHRIGWCTVQSIFEITRRRQNDLQYLRSRTCDVDGHSCEVRLHAEGDHGAAERVVRGGLISRTEKPVEQKTVFSNISEEIGVQAATDFWRPQISGVRSESLSVQTLTGTSGSDERIAGFCPGRPLKASDCGLKSHPSGNCRTSDQ